MSGDDWTRIVDDELRRSDGRRRTVVVRFTEADLAGVQTKDERVRTLRDAADRSQQAVREFVAGRNGVEITDSFWITNAVVLDVDTEQVPLEELAELPNVERIHEDATFEAFDGEATPNEDASATASGEYTYGLEQLNVPQVWTDVGTKGDGATVAVLDTGVDVGHPDLELYTDDPSDPTYPGGWKDFTDEGYDQPGDGEGHGTHVSGTVSGGNESGTHIGVAPACDLLHGKVLDDRGSGQFSWITNGIEWAVDRGADVINMSLGATGYYDQMIDPTRNAQSLGTLVVCASGNSYEGSSGSPGNVYGNTLAVGASDAAEDITGFSSGEVVDTSADWGSTAPENWPAEYVVPDVAAPGKAVYSSVPDGGYGEKPGTSMASPHVAGVAGLMVAASANTLKPTDIREFLEQTAWKPADWEEPSETIDGKDNRYGKGIVDAKAAADLAASAGTLSGTVTDSEGTAIADVELAASSGFTTTTAADGTYELTLPAGDHSVTVTKFGYAEANLTVTIVEGETTSKDVTLADELDGRVLEAQPTVVGGGEDVTATLEAANAATATVSLAGEYAESDTTLTVDGTTAAFGESVSISGGSVPVTVATTAVTDGTIDLEITFAGGGDTVTLLAGSTTVKERLITVGVVDASDSYGSGIVDTLEAELGGGYHVEETTTEAVANEPTAYDAIVAQNLDGGAASDFVAATDGDRTGVVYLDQWGSDANGIPTLESVTGDPETTGEAYNSAAPVFYEVEQLHPILDRAGGFTTGDRIDIHTEIWGDHTWFENTDFDVHASVGDQETGVEGAALAVDEATRTVLAASLGRSSYVEETDFTADGNAILAAAIDYVTPSLGETGLYLEVSGENGADAGGTAQLSIDATGIDEITITDLWADWGIDSVQGGGGAITDNIAADGTCNLEWDSAQKRVQPTVSIDLPSRYVGGVFLVTVTATAPGGESLKTTVPIGFDGQLLATA